MSGRLCHQRWVWSHWEDDTREWLGSAADFKSCRFIIDLQEKAQTWGEMVPCEVHVCCHFLLLGVKLLPPILSSIGSPVQSPPQQWLSAKSSETAASDLCPWCHSRWNHTSTTHAQIGTYVGRLCSADSLSTSILLPACPHKLDSQWSHWSDFALHQHITDVQLPLIQKLCQCNSPTSAQRFLREKAAIQVRQLFLQLILRVILDQLKQRLQVSSSTGSKVHKKLQNVGCTNTRYGAGTVFCEVVLLEGEQVWHFPIWRDGGCWYAVRHALFSKPLYPWLMTNQNWQTGVKGRQCNPLICMCDSWVKGWAPNSSIAILTCYRNF